MENFNISERPYYFEVEIINKYGLHARPAKILATEMKKYPQYNIRVRGPKGGEGSATSIIELMLFDANKGRKLGFKIRGEDPSKIESIIRDLFENVFPKIDEESL